MKKQRAFLKWAGGKFRLMEELSANLPEADTLVEPFVGAGSVFLNTNFNRYILADINPDLINLYKTIQSDSENYIQQARHYFTPEFNDKERYVDLRAQFNSTDDVFERSVLFLYLNRFGYNGLCRYNQKGGFNVPFGRYKKPYFPEVELRAFAEKSQKAVFICQEYTTTIKEAPKGSVIYCDPPYAPLSNTANFTSYSKNGFGINEQRKLGELAREVASSGTKVLISNHDTYDVRKWYAGAHFETVKVNRHISSKGSSRKKVDELFALFK